MKVLHLIDTLWLGGAQTMQRCYFENQEANTDIYLYVLRRSSPQLVIQHKNVVVYNSFSRYSLIPILSLRKYIKDNQIGVLHCHLLRSHLFGYILKRFFFRDLKFVIHEHGDIIANRRLSAAVLKMARNEASVFITCSGFLKKILVNKIKVSSSNVTVLYNFVDPKRFRPGKLRDSISDFRIGFAGRLVKGKGWEEFLEAARQSRSELSFQFIIAGEGKDRVNITETIQKFGLSNVSVAGFVEEMSVFYSGLNCFVLPSHYEPMWMVAIEAQAMGIPVIASNTDGLNEVVSDDWNALLFAPGSAEELVSAIRRVRDDPKIRARLIENGIENSKVYSLENYCNVLATVYSYLK